MSSALGYGVLRIGDHSRVLVGPPQDMRELFDRKQVLGYVEDVFHWPDEDVVGPTVEDEVRIVAGEEIELVETVT